jgi:hypothetical protein
METLTFRQPRLVALIILVLVSAGMSSFQSLGRHEDPTITNIVGTVTTRFPGVDPQRVETPVPIELLETLDDAKIEQPWTDTREAIADACSRFPAGVLALVYRRSAKRADAQRENTVMPVRLAAE